MHTFKNILFAGIIVFLFAPLAQLSFTVFEVAPLSGVHYSVDRPSLTFPGFYSGNFQTQVETFFKSSDAMRPPFIKVHNQLHYFKTGKSTNFVVVGKEDQLFSYDYWSAYKGFNYKGYTALKADVIKLKKLQNALRLLNKPFLYVIAPNKVRYMPEFLPNDLDGAPTDSCDYRTTLRLFKEMDINYLDLNAVFLQLKDTVRYPLFANTSIHWSGYGMSLGIQRILDSLENLGSEDILNLKFKNWHLQDSSITADKDMADLMNLVWPISTQKLAFPTVDLNNQSAAKPAKPFVVGDSFFWNLYYWDYRFQLLDEDMRFWYYNNKEMRFCLPDTVLHGKNASSLIETSDFVVFVTTEANLKNLTYGFPERFFKDEAKRDSANLHSPMPLHSQEGQ